VPLQERSGNNIIRSSAGITAMKVWKFIHIRFLTILLLGYNNNVLAQIDTLKVNFKSEGVSLSGEIYKPVKSKKKLVGIVFVTGSGSGSTVQNYKSLLADFFRESIASEQMVVLSYDKRGLGTSEGNWAKSDFKTRALDTENAAQFLSTLPYVDSSKIYVVGHSQGGWIVQICLANPNSIFKGGISLAGPTYNVKTQLINDYHGQYTSKENWSSKKYLGKLKIK
jgi:dipeptidyl aminopeptidase/acylaminoacyl peptidase